jgi:hypothetical protein
MSWCWYSFCDMIHYDSLLDDVVQCDDFLCSVLLCSSIDVLSGPVLWSLYATRLNREPLLISKLAEVSLACCERSLNDCNSATIITSSYTICTQLYVASTFVK